MNDLVTTREVADELAVKPSTVKNWRTRKLFGVPFFTADERHGDTWYYYRERVEQLKSVYQPGILQNMYKLAWLSPENEETPDGDFQKSDSSRSPISSMDSISESYNAPPPIGYHNRGYLTLAQVTEKLNVEEANVRKWVERGRLRWDRYDHANKWLFKEETVKEFANRRTNAQTKEAEVPASRVLTKEEEPFMTKQERIEQAKKLFDLLYGKIPALNFAYLWTKNNATYSFEVADPEQRLAMAKQAITLADKGVNVWHCVNPVKVKPTNGRRGDELTVSYQVGCITDIDIKSDAHKSDNVAADFDEAKSFLPFAPSLIIDSGYGLHAYYLFDNPIEITDDNRADLKRRNSLLLDVIRSRANGKTIDGVGDLPRILRTPGTFNFKIEGTSPLCRIVEDTGLRFSPSQLVGELNALVIPNNIKNFQKYEKSARGTFDDKDLNIYRAHRMLDFISPSTLSYDDWLAVGMALKNIGMSFSDWEQWSRADDRFKDGECESKWAGFNGDGYDFGTLYHFAEQTGYDAKEIFREYQSLHPEYKQSTRADSYNQVNSNIRADYIGTKKKISSCPIDLEIPDCFDFSSKGIKFKVFGKVKVDKETGEQEQKVTTYPVTTVPVVPTKIFYNPDRKTDEYEIAVLSRGWRYAEMTAPELYDNKGLLNLTKYGAGILDFKRLSRYFAEIIALNEIPVVEAYDHTGWVNNCTEFIYPHEDAQYLLRRPGFDFANDLKARGSKEEFIRLFTEIDDCGHVARIAIGHILAAPLVRPLGLSNLQAHVDGASGIGKTPLIKFGASIFGNPNPGGLARTFTASYKNQLEMASAFCDLPHVLEEKETLGKDKEEGLQQAVYDYQQGIANQNQKRDGTAREVKKFYGSRISDGENPLLKPNARKGAFKRVLPLHCDRLFDNDFAVKVHQFCNDNYALFGWDWIRYIQEHKESIKQTYDKNVEFINRQERKINPFWCTTIAAALAAYQHFRQNVVGITYSLGHKDLEGDMYILCRELPADTDLDDYKRAIADLESFINAHPDNFSYDQQNPANRNQFDFISARSSSATYGHKFLNGEIAFYRTELVEILEKKLGYASGKKLIDDFCEHNLLRHNADRPTFRIFVGNPREQKRAILFKSDVFAVASDDTDA